MKLSRRGFIRLSGIVGAGILLPGQLSQLLTQDVVLPLPPQVLTKYLDPLFYPSTAQPVDKLQSTKYYEIKMSQFQQKLHSQLPPTTLWGYNGSFPGPIIEARSQETTLVKWINNLTTPNYLIPGAFDASLHGTDKQEPEVKTVVHVHGAHVPVQWDGHPEAWFTSNVE